MFAAAGTLVTGAACSNEALGVLLDTFPEHGS